MIAKQLPILTYFMLLHAGSFLLPSGEHKQMSGIWSINLIVQAPASGRPMPSVTRTCFQIVLLPRTQNQNFTWMEISGYTYYGVYNGDLSPFGLLVADEERVPLAAAKQDGDSLQVVLNPIHNHGSMVLRGFLTEGRISGSWYVTGYSPGASGEFTMARPESGETTSLPTTSGDQLAPECGDGSRQR
jgi:hypothetical protein